MDLSKSIEAIINKAWQDPTFKSNLIDNPVATLKNFLGEDLELPQGKRIAVIDQSDDSTFYINIPAQQKLDDVELNEEQLDIISGGGNPFGVLNKPGD